MKYVLFGGGEKMFSCWKMTRKRLNLIDWSIPLFLKILINSHQFHVALPAFLTKPQDIKTGINGVAKFECVATGNPQPSVFWTKEGSQELMFPDNVYGHLQVTSEGTLEIRSVQKEDAGYYVCSAFSIAGSGTTRAFLQVSFISHCTCPQRTKTLISLQLNLNQPKKPHVKQKRFALVLKFMAHTLLAMSVNYSSRSYPDKKLWNLRNS